jgi:hypothetical protein
MSWRHGVKRDQSQTSNLYRILHKALPTQVTMAWKRAPQLVSVVVVSRHQIHRHQQGRQQVCQMVVFLSATEVREVTGYYHGIGLLWQA